MKKNESEGYYGKVDRLGRFNTHGSNYALIVEDYRRQLEDEYSVSDVLSGPFFKVDLYSTLKETRKKFRQSKEDIEEEDVTNHSWSQRKAVYLTEILINEDNGREGLPLFEHNVDSEYMLVQNVSVHQPRAWDGFWEDEIAIERYSTYGELEEAIKKPWSEGPWIRQPESWTELNYRMGVKILEKYKKK